MTWDDMLCAIHGVAADEAPRTVAEMMARVHPDDRARTGETVRRRSSRASPTSSSTA
jgi:hypothetical protein